MIDTKHQSKQGGLSDVNKRSLLKQLIILIVIIIVLIGTAIEQYNQNNKDNKNKDSISAWNIPQGWWNVDTGAEEVHIITNGSKIKTVFVSGDNEYKYCIIKMYQLLESNKCVDYKVSKIDLEKFKLEKIWDSYEVETIIPRYNSGKYKLEFYIALDDGSTKKIGKEISINFDNIDDPFNYLESTYYVKYMINDIVSISNGYTGGLEDSKDVVTEYDKDVTLEYITNVYEKLIKYSYNSKLADEIISNPYEYTHYRPDPLKTLRSESGICFDIAAAYVSLMRVRNIPCRLVFGDVNNEYHAWVEVFIKDENGSYTWNLVDPTLKNIFNKPYTTSYTVQGYS